MHDHVTVHCVQLPSHHWQCVPPPPTPPHSLTAPDPSTSTPPTPWAGPLTCKADGTLEGASHALEAVLDQVTQELGRRVKHLVTQLALMIDAFLCNTRAWYNRLHTPAGSDREKERMRDRETQTHAAKRQGTTFLHINRLRGHLVSKRSKSFRDLSSERVIFLFLPSLAHHLWSQAYNLQLWTVWPPVPSLLPLLCPVPSLSRPVIACCPPSAAGSVPSLCPLLYFKPAWVTSVPPPAGVGQMKGGRRVLAGRLCSRLITHPPHRTEPGPPACAPSDTRRQTPTPIPRTPNWALGYGRRRHRPPSSQSVQHPASPCRQARRVLLLSYGVRGGLIKSSIIYPHHHPDLHLPPLPSRSHLRRFQSPLRLKGPHKGALIPVWKEREERWRGQREWRGGLARAPLWSVLPHCLLKDIAFGRGGGFLSGRMKAAADRGYDWV